MICKYLFRFIVFVTVFCTLPSCEKEQTEPTLEEVARAYYDQFRGKEGWYDTVAEEGLFFRAAPVTLYYIDENGKDLINPDDISTLPVSTDKLLSEPPATPTDFSNGMYNGNINILGYDDEEGLNCVGVFALGSSGSASFTSYVYFKGKPDCMDIDYIYTTEDISGGGAYAYIVAWKVNGIFVYTDHGDLRSKVFIRKAGDQTTVTYKTSSRW